MPLTVEPVVAAGTMSSIPQPTVEIDDELTLRPFSDDDAPLVMAAFDDPGIRHWHGRRIDSIAEAHESMQRGHTMWKSETCSNWAVAGPDDVMVGRVALYTDLSRGTAEIAYWVLPEARRRGIAVRAATAATRWGHDWLGLRRVLLQHSVENHASCAVARSLGYELEGTARSAGLHEDGWHDMHQHAHVAGEP